MTFTLEDQKYETIQSFMENFSNEVDRSAILESLFDGGNCELYQNLYNHVKHFYSKFDQIRWKLRSWSHLLKKILMQSCLNQDFNYRFVKTSVRLNYYVQVRTIMCSWRNLYTELKV